MITKIAAIALFAALSIFPLQANAADMETNVAKTFRNSTFAFFDEPQTRVEGLPDFEDLVFFAHIAIGSGWSSQIAISNNSPTRSLTGVYGITVDASTPGALTWE